VLELLAEGAADKTIAEKLAISRKTVEKHVSAVLRKTGTESRTAAVMCALDREWLPGRLSRDHPG
jgi:DNA-binding NarL/FixJ family response regulator